MITFLQVLKAIGTQSSTDWRGSEFMDELIKSKP